MSLTYPVRGKYAPDASASTHFRKSASKDAPASSEPFRIERYRDGRHWAVLESRSGEMVCLCVYRKGALEVVRRLAQTPGEART